MTQKIDFIPEITNAEVQTTARWMRKKAYSNISIADRVCRRINITLGDRDITLGDRAELVKCPYIY